jgi:hypothetical protein
MKNNTILSILGFATFNLAMASSPVDSFNDNVQSDVSASFDAVEEDNNVPMNIHGPRKNQKKPLQTSFFNDNKMTIAYTMIPVTAISAGALSYYFINNKFKADLASKDVTIAAQQKNIDDLQKTQLNASNILRMADQVVDANTAISAKDKALYKKMIGTAQMAANFAPNNINPIQLYSMYKTLTKDGMEPEQMMNNMTNLLDNAMGEKAKQLFEDFTGKKIFQEEKKNIINNNDNNEDND